MRFVALLPVAALFVAGHADAAMTGIYRTNNASGSATNLTGYASLQALASNSGAANPLTIDPSIADARYTSVFGDFVQSQTTQGYIYKTVYGGNGRISQIVRYLADSFDPLANFRNNIGGETFNLSGFGGSGGWDREDDFFHDGTSFYRNMSTGSGSTGVVRYGSFADLVAGTNGTTFNYSTTYGYNDRFFGFEGKIYRTNTGGPGGSVSGFAVYNSFSDLLTGTVAQTISSNNWSATDMFIAVPAPGALALLGMAGLFGAGRKRR
jgi:hypothetical protein